MKHLARMTLLLAAGLMAVGLSSAARADDAQACAAAAGNFLTGTVVEAPHYVPGKSQRGVTLSHTRLNLRDDSGKTYEVAMDNVFASGYDSAGSSVPTPLNRIHVGTRLQLCGQPYRGGRPGMHWVHSNCGETPNPAAPDGWVKIVGDDGRVSENLESSQEYCGLWSGSGRHHH